MVEFFADQYPDNGHKPDIDGIRLELYRLYTIYMSSKPIAESFHDNPAKNFMVYHQLDFSDTEITRILLNTAIVGRVVDDKYEKIVEDSTNCGDLYIDHEENSKSIPLTLRESFNKIIHADTVNLDIANYKWLHTYGQYATYLRPKIYLYGMRGKTRWRAVLKVYDYIAEYHTRIDLP